MELLQGRWTPRMVSPILQSVSKPSLKNEIFDRAKLPPLADTEHKGRVPSFSARQIGPKCQSKLK